MEFHDTAILDLVIFSGVVVTAAVGVATELTFSLADDAGRKMTHAVVRLRGQQKMETL